LAGGILQLEGEDASARFYGFGLVGFVGLEGFVDGVEGGGGGKGVYTG